MLKIKNKFGSDLNSFDLQQITTSKVKKLLKEIEIKKAVGIDTVPPKLIKIGADIIAESLTQARYAGFAACVKVFFQIMLKMLLYFLPRKKNLVNMTF